MECPSKDSLLPGIVGSRFVRLLTLAWLLCGSAQPVLSAEPQKSVLLLFESRRDMKSNVVVEQAIRRILDEEFTVELDIRSEYLEEASSDEDFPVLLSWLRRKYSGLTFDVVIPVDTAAIQFVSNYGKEMFRGAPMVYWGRKAGLEFWDKNSPIAAVVAPERNDQVKGTFAFIRALQPDLERLVVVSGAAPTDRLWETAARQELGPFERSIAITYLSGLTLEDIQNRLSALPKRTAVLFLTIFEDGAGRKLLRSQYLSRILQTTTAPVYSTSAVYLDTGIVGGALIDQEEMAIEAGHLAARVLRGEDIRKLPIQESTLVPMANWKALRRWDLSESTLPQGTVVMYKEQSLWDLYRWRIVGVLSLCSLEAALIVALLVQRSHRRRAEKGMVESQRLLQSTIDALNARVALLEPDGSILAANRRWKSFEETEPHDGSGNGVAYNYLEACSAAQTEEKRRISDGIRKVMTGELEDFRCIYPSAKADGTSWFQVRINPVDMSGSMRLVVTCEDVTEIKQAHDTQQQLTGLLVRAQDEERRRIARDLHDVSVQNVVAVKAALASIDRASQRNGFAPDEILHESVSLCDQVIKELRTLSYLLHPPFLDEAGLVPALQWFVRGFIQRSGIQVEVLVIGEIGRLPTEVETALFRVVQESLTNIHRHSGSKRAVIWVSKEQDTVVLQISDEGHGFLQTPVTDTQEGTSLPGVGIAGMRQRLRQLGGQLEIESSPRGTRVNARVSVSEDQNAYLIGR